MTKKQKEPRTHGIQLRLTAALAALLGLCLLAVWFSLTYLLQPVYDRYIRRGLEGQMSVLCELIDNNDGPIARYGFFSSQVDEGFLAAVEQAIQSGRLDISKSCVDVFDSSLRTITYAENVQPCLIHGTNQRFGIRLDGNRDSAAALQLRQAVFANGGYYTILESNGRRQLVVGVPSANGSYGVIVSTDLTQVAAAGEVLGLLVPEIAMALLIVSMLLAAWFSAWFTRPLKKMEQASRELARGNYSARLTDVRRKDELGDLSRAFNQMADQVERSARSQRELLANVSHDLRTPLTLIRGYAETVRDLTGDDPEKRNRQLNVIVEETDRLGGLVNSVMELSRMSSGTEPLHLTRFDMAQLCGEVAERYAALCPQNGWTLAVEAEQPCPVTADPALMERVLHNLLGNAANHLGEDGWFALRAIPTPGGCRVEVEDHGAGIAAADLPYIFDRYYRSRKDSGKVGTGLGLAITKAILQSHGFRFGVNSTEGKGTTFWFEAGEAKQ